VFGLLSLGVQRVSVVNRTLEKANALRAFFGDKVIARDWPGLGAELPSCDMLVNTTSLGMSGQPELMVDLTALDRRAVVADIVYRPLETRLLAQARARGHTTIDGLGMLMHQARPGFAAWFGVEPQVTPTLKAHLVSIMEGRG
jgi:shikimate dehydrogenase